MTIREAILYEGHNTPYAGHLGTARMKHSLARYFYWPKMQEDIERYVKGCQECQRSKARHHPKIGRFTPLIPPERRWSEISMDFITDLPRTESGHDSILVIMDSVSKRVHLIKFNMTWGAAETAKLYFQEIFKHHGLSDRIVSDRNTRFTSKFWQELCRLLGTRVAMSTSFHPQSNGANERSHKVIEEMLRCILAVRAASCTSSSSSKFCCGPCTSSRLG